MNKHVEYLRDVASGAAKFDAHQLQAAANALEQELIAITSGFDQISHDRDEWKASWRALYKTMIAHGHSFVPPWQKERLKHFADSHRSPSDDDV